MGFKLREVLEQLPPTNFKNIFFSVDDLNMVQLTQKMQTSERKKVKKVREKNAKNALTSHYANGHEWVKNHTADSTTLQVDFFELLAIFQDEPSVGVLWKIAKSLKKSPPFCLYDKRTLSYKCVLLYFFGKV